MADDLLPPHDPAVTIAELEDALHAALTDSRTKDEQLAALRAELAAAAAAPTPDPVPAAPAVRRSFLEEVFQK